MDRCDSTRELQMWQLQLEVAGKRSRQPHIWAKAVVAMEGHPARKARERIEDEVCAEIIHPELLSTDTVSSKSKK